MNRKYQKFRRRTNSVLKTSFFLSMRRNDSSEINVDNETNEEQLPKFEDISRDIGVKMDDIEEEKLSENSIVLKHDKNRKVMKARKDRNSFLNSSEYNQVAAMKIDGEGKEQTLP